MASIYLSFKARKASHDGRPQISSADRRLKDLPSGAWTPALFHQATEEFLQDTGFDVQILRKGDAVPRRMPETRFRYDLDLADEIADGALVAAVLEEGCYIGYGTAKQPPSPHEISVIDVDHYSRRSPDFQHKLTIAGSEFSVGVGHIILAGLIAVLDRPILADATHGASRYVCRSLGFVPDPTSEKPDRMRLVATSAA